MAFSYSDQTSNRGGVALYLYDVGVMSKEGSAIDLSSFTAPGSHYFWFGSQPTGMVTSYLAHEQIYTNSFFDPNQSVIPLL